ncbi:MAG: GH116 family glycosyl-hydrolase [Spirochaetaceae bacterium]|nr:GH116 family glycosyl-hydrolase [Spirochaetaceae bacterium]
MLRRYDQDHLRMIALPLGGVGTGTVSLGGRGNLRDWEIMNRPAKGFAPPDSFFAVYTEQPGGKRHARALEGPIDEADYITGQKGCGEPNHGLPRFRSCSFSAAYPFGQAELADPDLPVTAVVQGFNPLIPGDVAASSIPAAILRFVVTNTTAAPLRVAVCGTIANVVGYDGTLGAPAGNCNEYRKREGEAPVRGMLLSSEGVDAAAEQAGTIALATDAAGELTWRTAWLDEPAPWPLRDFWQDFSADGRLEARDAGEGATPHASLAVALALPAHGSASVSFVIGWHFPNRMAWTPIGGFAEPAFAGGGDGPGTGGPRVGNHYATRYRDAWEVVERTFADLPRLEADTAAFVRALCESDLPEAVKEAALFNVSTLRTQICFRTEDGSFHGFEGGFSNEGCCMGSCNHVWGYEHATASLFLELSQRMREVQFLHATDDDGLMHFRVHLPLPRARDHSFAAADGQMASILKLYRDWQLSGDSAWLARLWPKARACMEFCWIPGGWDGDRDGVMEGPQHNTLDYELFGPNPLMAAWYLAALHAAERMARAMDDAAFADRCRELARRGRAWVDEHLFNGEYYEQQVRPPVPGAAAPRGLVMEHAERRLRMPDQLGAGCQVDQLAGQYAAHVCGLGYVLGPEQVRRTLHSILRYNYRTEFHSHFNHLRTFALGDEQALIYASYPRGGEPPWSLRRKSEIWNGSEYTAAVGMLYAGQVEAGLQVIEAIRNRYDGRKRNPFSEIECGEHYVRSMAAWSALLALTGFAYSRLTGTLTFNAAARRADWVWSNGTAWGRCRQTPFAGATEATVTVGGGELELRELVLRGRGSASLPRRRTVPAGDSVTVTVAR